MLRELKLESEQYQAITPPRELPIALRTDDGCIEVKGKKVVDYSSWDFLGLSKNPRLLRAAQLSLEECGVSSCSPRLFGGTSILHRRAETSLAAFLGQNSAISFSSRNQAALSIVSSMMSERDALLCDEHSSLPCSDAAYLSNSSIHYFRSDEPDTLEAALENCATKRRRLVCIETISPLTGAVSPLPELIAAARRHSAGVVVDESFAVGAIGSRGAGVSDGFQFGEELIAIVVDSSLGLASGATYVCGSSIAIDYLLSRSRTFQSEVAPCPALCAALEAALAACELDITSRAKLQRSAAYFSSNLAKTGLKVLGGDSPVICVLFERRSLARAFADAMFKRGSLCDVLPLNFSLKESCVVRFVVRACHSESQIEASLQVASDVVGRVER